MKITDLPENEKKTFYYDTVRGAFDGIVQSIGMTVVLYIAIRIFSVNDTWKTIINGAWFAGLIGSIGLAWMASGSRFRTSQLAAVPLLVASLFFTLSTFVTDGLAFSLLISCALLMPNLRIPLLSSLYAQNYEVTRRGKLYSWALLALIATTLLANFLFGTLLDANTDHYKLILYIAAAASLLSALVTLRIPSEVSTVKRSAHPFADISLIWKDKLFGYVLAAWFLIGFGNLWSKPLRVVYLAEPERGLGLSAFTVMLILGVVPEIPRLLFTRVWAHLFDHMNFIVLRIILNLFFGAGLLLFFITENIYVIGLGSFLVGTGFAGGGVAWHLWITRYAPREKSHVYMSIHTALTGLRGMIGPWFAFLFVKHFSIPAIGYASLILVLVSCLMLLPLVKMKERFQ